jgi:hypothetical protein
LGKLKIARTLGCGFFHMIPGFTETSRRLPAGHPLALSPDTPELQAAIGGAFLVFLIGAVLQVRRLRAHARRAEPTDSGVQVV